MSYKSDFDAWHKQYLMDKLREHRGNVANAADDIRIHRVTLYTMIKKYDLSEYADSQRPLKRQRQKSGSRVDKTDGVSSELLNQPPYCWG